MLEPVVLKLEARHTSLGVWRVGREGGEVVHPLHALMSVLGVGLDSSCTESRLALVKRELGSW